MKKQITYLVVWALLTGAFVGFARAGGLAEANEWVLVSPVGEYGGKKIELAPRLPTLQGKKIGLKWNAKPNGNVFLDRIAELLKERVPGVEIIKFYQAEPSTVPQSTSADVAKQKAKAIASHKPDLVIGAQCD
jgi:hypothetical protein